MSGCSELSVILVSDEGELEDAENDLFSIRLVLSFDVAGHASFERWSGTDAPARDAGSAFEPDHVADMMRCYS